MGGESESFALEQCEVAKQIAAGGALPAVLEAIVRLIEARSAGMLCSILLVDAEHNVVRHGAAPSLPPEYIKSLDGAEIGLTTGSCGAAAYHRERVIVEDIATHPNWAPYRELALAHQLRACWSTPILSPDREALGTFAMYYREARGPSLQEIEWVAAATHLAAIAILRDKSEQSLRKSEARAKQLAQLHAVSSAVNEAIVRVRSPLELYLVACRIAVEKGLARLAWVGLVDAAGDLINPVARFGLPDGYVDAIRLQVDDGHVTPGPAGQAVLTGQPAVTNDIAADPHFFWKEEALRNGLRASAVFPLELRGAIIGVFAIYSDRVGAFGVEEMQVLSTLAGDISFAVESAENDRERRQLFGELRERVKELTLLHQATRLLQVDRQIDLALFTELVGLLPSAFHHPELCAARISWAGLAAATPGFHDAPRQLVERFQAAGGEGAIEVVSLDAPHLSAVDFAREERELIRSLADMLSSHITKVRAAQALKASEERLRAVIENTPNVCIQWYDSAGKMLFCNRASLRLFGWEPDKVIGKSLQEIGFWEGAEEARFARLRAIAGRGEVTDPTEFAFRRIDGGPGWLLSTVFNILDHEGRPCTVCMDVDLSEQHRIAAVVREHEALLSSIYDSVADIIFSLGVEADGGYRFLSANAAFLSITGLEHGQIVGHRVEEVIPEPSRASALEHYREAVRSGKRVTWEEVSAYPAGVRHGEVAVSPILDASGRCTHLVGTVHDVTARRQAESERSRLGAELQQAHRLRALGTLAGGIAHDFNNILSAITANTELALLDLSEPAAVINSLREIQKATGRATDLVRQILTFGHRDDSRRRVTALRPIVEEVVELVRATLPAGVEVRTHSSEAPMVLADSTQLHQVVMNLVVNAGQALGEQGGTIEVGLDTVVIGQDGPKEPSLAEGRYAHLTVRDEGCGMDDATMRLIFDPFFTTKPVGVGTGLGLSVVHSIVTAHQGVIRVESRLGVGTTFHVYLPGTEAARADPAPEGPAPAGRGELVLYVDDEEAVLLGAGRALGRLGYRPVTHADSTKALADLRSRPGKFDIVVADLVMPGLSGLELVAAVRALRPDIPVIVTATFVSADDLRRVQALGLAELVLKPHSADELGRALRRLLDATRR